MLMENKEPEGYRDEGTRTTFRESVPERKGVTKVVGPSGKEGPVEPIKEKTVARVPAKRY